MFKHFIIVMGILAVRVGTEDSSAELEVPDSKEQEAENSELEILVNKVEDVENSVLEFLGSKKEKAENSETIKVPTKIKKPKAAAIEQSLLRSLSSSEPKPYTESSSIEPTLRTSGTTSTITYPKYKDCTRVFNPYYPDSGYLICPEYKYSPYYTHCTYIHYPYYPDAGYYICHHEDYSTSYGKKECYYKKQYSAGQLQHTWNGLHYVYHYDCVKCCHYQNSLHQDCFIVGDKYCNPDGN